MMTNLFHVLGTAITASAPLSSTLGTLLPAALLVCVVVMALGGLRWRALAAEHTTQTQQLQQQNDLLRAAVEQQQRLRAELDERQREAQSLRQESGAQRKKNHVLQDEIKRLRTSLKEETERRVAAQNSRPAFAEPSASRAAKAAGQLAPSGASHAASGSASGGAPDTEPKIAIEGLREAPKAARPVEPRQAPLAAPPATGPSELALQAQIKTLEAEMGRQAQAIGEERLLMTGLKDELKKTRKRSEDLRRIDIITKSKMEILEDKLRHLGRAHYEAISEVALLKGEVRPPKPREAPQRASAFEAPDAPEAAALVEVELADTDDLAQDAKLAEALAGAADADAQAVEDAHAAADATDTARAAEDAHAAADAADAAQDAEDAADAENDGHFAPTRPHDAPGVAEQASLL